MPKGSIASFVLVSVFCLASWQAEATGLTPISQTRYVVAMTPASNVVQNAADFGSFNASVSSVYNLPPDMSASAAGSQQSQILDSSIIASGSGGGGQHGQYFQGTSYFSVTFTLGSDSAFTLGGNIADPAYESGLQFSLYTQLTGPNGQIFQTPLDYRVFGGGYTYSTNGVLA